MTKDEIKEAHKGVFNSIIEGVSIDTDATELNDLQSKAHTAITLRAIIEELESIEGSHTLYSDGSCRTLGYKYLKTRIKELKEL